VDVEKLIEFVGRKGGEVTPSQVASGMRSYRGDSLQARVDLDLLAVCGFGQWVDRRPGPRGGRPTRTFRLSGKVALMSGEVCEVSGKDRP